MNFINIVWFIKAIIMIIVKMAMTCDFPFFVLYPANSFKNIPHPFCQNERIQFPPTYFYPASRHEKFCHPVINEGNNLFYLKTERVFSFSLQDGSKLRLDLQIIHFLFTSFIIIHSFRSCCGQFWIVSSGILHGGYFCFSQCCFRLSTSFCETRSRRQRPCSYD